MRKCFICQNSRKPAIFADFGKHNYLQCPGCGLLYVDRIEPTSVLHLSYTGGFLKSLRRRLIAPFRGFSQVRHFKESMDRAAKIFDFASSQHSPRGGRPAFLDIGCNKGFLLAVAASKSWNVFGIETVPELTVPFRRKFKEFSGQVFPTLFSETQSRFPNNTFDLITAIDVIEHFEDPLTDLKNIHRILKKGGVFVAQTPDGALELRELRDKWGALKPLEHLHLFNRSNLGRLAKKLGFKGIKFFEAAEGNFTAVLRKG